MNCILFEPEEVDNNRAVIADHRAKHIVKVLGSNVGDSLKVGIVGGQLGTGEILSIKRKYPHRVELSLELTDEPDQEINIDLLLALPRPIMLKRIFSQATALGVGKFYLIHARRVEKSYWNGSIVEEKNYRPHLLQGLEQAIDTNLPEVMFHKRFKPFVEDVLPTIKNHYSHLLLAHPEGKNTLVEAIHAKPERVLLAVGPEGGWVEYEIDKFKEQGFKTISIGERILKVDTAVITLHGRINCIKELLSRQTMRVIDGTSRKSITR